MDIQSLLQELSSALGSPDFPDALSIAAALGLDMAHARVTKTRAGPLGINGAQMPDLGEVGVLASVLPTHQIVVVFRNGLVPYGKIASVTLGDNQHMRPAKRGNGLAVVFDVGAFKGVLTASGPEGIVETLSVEARSIA